MGGVIIVDVGAEALKSCEVARSWAPHPILICRPEGQREPGRARSGLLLRAERGTLEARRSLGLDTSCRGAWKLYWERPR